MILSCTKYHIIPTITWLDKIMSVYLDIYQGRYRVHVEDTEYRPYKYDKQYDRGKKQKKLSPTGTPTYYLQGRATFTSLHGALILVCGLGRALCDVRSFQLPIRSEVSYLVPFTCYIRAPLPFSHFLISRERGPIYFHSYFHIFSRLSLIIYLQLFFVWIAVFLTPFQSRRRVNSDSLSAHR